MYIFILVFFFYSLHSSNIFHKSEALVTDSSSHKVTDGLVKTDLYKPDGDAVITNTNKQEIKIDKHCFLNEFSENNFPWKPEDCLNFEEVFKNYQYDEAIFLEDSAALTIKKFISGKLQNVNHYILTKENKLKTQE